MTPAVHFCFRVGTVATLVTSAAHTEPAARVEAFPVAKERLERAAQSGRTTGVFHWVIREGTVRLMFTDQLNFGADFRFGLGLEIMAVTQGNGAERRTIIGYTWGGCASTDFRVLPSEHSIQLVLRQEVPFDNSLSRELNAEVDAAWPPTRGSALGTQP